MPQPLETLIFVHRLTASETAAVFAHDAVFPASGLKPRLLEAIEEACLDRLIRAGGCLDLANRLFSAAADEETLRAAISRAYYSWTDAAWFNLDLVNEISQAALRFVGS